MTSEEKSGVWAENFSQNNLERPKAPPQIEKRAAIGARYNLAF
jgi:hypothetical protein